MPHVFNMELGKFEQINQKKVPQRASTAIQKRQRISEYTKFQLELEAEAKAKAERRQARRDALKGK